MSEYSFETGSAGFAKDVLSASNAVPVLVDFWAPWCGPCRALKPVLEKLAQEYAGRFLLAKVNTDEHAEIAAEYGVRGIPNVKAFVGGKLVSEFTGALPEAKLREFIETLLPTAGESLRQAARADVAAGDFEAAEIKLLEALKLEPQNNAVRVDLTELLVARQAYEQAERVMDEVAVQHRDERAEQIAQRIAVWKKGSVLPDLQVLRARVDAAPDDLDARQSYGERLIVENDYAQALEVLLGIVSRGNEAQRRLARQSMIDIFQLAADDRELVGEYRRRLASVLN